MTERPKSLIAYLLEKQYENKPCPFYVALFYLCYCNRPISHIYSDGSIDVIKRVASNEYKLIALYPIDDSGPTSEYPVTLEQIFEGNARGMEDQYYWIRLTTPYLRGLNNDEDFIRLFRNVTNS